LALTQSGGDVVQMPLAKVVRGPLVKLISEIEIEGFRSIRSTILSGLNDFTTLAGLNNSGKSNALRALNSFLMAKPIWE
jgi:hypothetical protein